MFRAYFREGRDLCDADVLADAAAAAGLDRAGAAAAIAAGTGEASVAEDVQRAGEAEISGVPFYVLAGRFGIPGAQPVEVMQRLLERAQARLA